MTENTYSLPVGETVKTAWAKLSGAKGSIWAILGLLFLAVFITGFLGKLFAQGLFNFIGWLIQIIGNACILYLGIRRAQDMPIQYKMAKEVITLRVILSMIGVIIIQTLVYIPAGLLVALGVYLMHFQTTIMNIIAVLLYIASIVLFIFLMVRMWLGYGFVIDKKLNPWEAIKFSFKSTDGNVWNLIGIFLIEFGAMILCTITLGIGFIWGFPWMVILYGETYKRLSTRQDVRHIH